MEVLDRPVRKNNAEVHFKLGFLDFGFFNKVYNALPVLRMEPTKENSLFDASSSGLMSCIR